MGGRVGDTRADHEDSASGLCSHMHNGWTYTMLHILSVSALETKKSEVENEYDRIVFGMMLKAGSTQTHEMLEYVFEHAGGLVCDDYTHICQWAEP